MKQQLKVIEEYRFDTEAEVKEFIEESKDQAFHGGYTLTNYSSNYKEKKAKGEVVATGYLVRITKHISGFWDIEEALD